MTTQHDHSISITVAQARAMLLFVASKKDPRPYLRGIHVECCNPYTRLVATDGHALAVLTLNTPNVGNLSEILQADDLENCLKRATVGIARHAESTTALTIKISGEQWTAADQEHLYFKLIDAVYPNWRIVVQHNQEIAPSQFDVRLLDKFVKARQILVDCKKEHVGHIYVEPHGDASAYVYIGCNEFFGVVMPYRDFGVAEEGVKKALENAFAIEEKLENNARP